MPNTGSLFYRPRKKPDAEKKEISKKRWNWPSIIWKAVKRTCMVIGGMVLFSAILSTVLIASVGKKTAPPLPQKMVLLLTLDDGIADKPDELSFGEFLPSNRPSIRQVIEVLHYAETDDRVRGVVLNMKGGSLSLAHIEEVRGAVKRFQRSGKKTYFYTPSMAEAGGLGAYYLAAAFDEIWMQPVGMLSIAGLNIEVPLAKDALEKLGISAEFLTREEFKNAMEMFTESEMSDNSLMSWTTLVSSLSAQMMTAIREDRKFEGLEFKEYVDLGLLTGEEALKLKLIDRLDYSDVLEDELRVLTEQDTAEDLDLVSFAQYAHAQDGIKSLRSHKYVPVFPKVALIYINGQIVSSDMGQGATAAADVIAPAIREAADDEDIKVIVLRINSPGGSPSASETIRRAIVKAKEKGKKVVVSMGDLAASGGYWIAAEADFIFADEATITGSIGVLMGKFEASALWEKAGVNWGGLQWGANADIWSLNEPFDAAAMARLNVVIDDTYNTFLDIVANGRKLDKDVVRELAKGRAWTGKLAGHQRLVDSFGGLYDALDFAAGEHEVAGIHEIDVMVLPRPKTPIEQLLEILEMQGSMVSVMARAMPFLESVAPAMNAAQMSQKGSAMVYDATLDAAKIK